MKSCDLLCLSVLNLLFLADARGAGIHDTYKTKVDVKVSPVNFSHYGVSFLP